jgi:uncharacterized repeat protein (TIGR03803 family)
MRLSRFFVFMFASSALLFVLAGSSSAQTVKVVHTFTGQNSSDEPSNVTPAQGSDGALYGTTQGPSSANSGTIFKLATAGTFRQLYIFESATGSQPDGGVTLASDGSFYGATDFGGSSNDGVLFKITSNGTYSVLHEFAGGTDGVEPASPPIEASDGNLYGATYGSTSTSSTIYKYTLSSGTFSTIYQFGGSYGSNVIGSLLQAANGDLYGTAYYGGTSGCGTIFEVTTSGTPLWSYSFPCGTGGANPVGALIQANDGNFYGTASQGGGAGRGAIFKLTQNHVVSILYSFLGYPTDGQIPFGGLVQGNDGNLYGTTYRGGTSGDGVLFQITTAGTYDLLYSFSNSIGARPRAALLQHTNGLFYGTASGGGKREEGSVFSLDMGLGPFVTFVTTTGGTGQTAQILGQGLTGATGVTFNGVAATSFEVVSDTFMTAVVPSAATTGPVVVTTPGGALISNVSFRIIK